MRTYLQCIKKRVLYENNAEFISCINDIIFDTNSRKMKAIILDNDKIILYQDIISWKINIYVQKNTILHEEDSVKEIQGIISKNISILGNKAISADGSHIGYCDDIVFNDKFGNIESVIIKKYFLFTIPYKTLIISSKDIISINSDCIVIKDNLIKSVIPESNV